MTLQAAYDFLNFWISKYTGSFYSPPELDLIVDRGQMSLFSELRPKYATSQRIKDALSPFISRYDFLAGDTPAGLITIPSNQNCLAILDIMISYVDGATTRYAAVPILNSDERGDRLRSQIVAPTATEPIAESAGANILQLWPKSAMAGTVTFLKRPVAPVFAYSLISGRVISYNSDGSTQLQWGEDWQNAVLLKALSSIGINLTDAEISGYAEQKTNQNAQNFNNT